MAEALKIVSVQRGHDPRDFVLAAFGGAGPLHAAALAAMERLRDAGVAVIPITCRPAGWCDHIARMWPVAAVVGENGAFYYRYDRTLRKMQRRYFKTAEQRAADRAPEARRAVLEPPTDREAGFDGSTAGLGHIDGDCTILCKGHPGAVVSGCRESAQ